MSASACTSTQASWRRGICSMSICSDSRKSRLCNGHRSQAGVSIEPFVECSRPVRGCGGDDGGRRSGRHPGTIFLANLLARGVPIEPINPVYTHECGSCHVAYPPSLAPAEMWTVVMDGLSDHFGESASLDLGTAAKLRDWLVANASERWDTQASNVFRRLSPSKPQLITATPSWVQFHRRLPEALFRAHAIGAKGTCNACHQDAATGRFESQRIAIPKAARQ